MLATVIDFLSSYCLISNQPVAGSIIVVHFKGGILTPLILLLILHGPMRLTHSLSHGFTSAVFSGRRPYFFTCFFSFWQMAHVIGLIWFIQNVLQKLNMTSLKDHQCTQTLNLKRAHTFILERYQDFYTNPWVNIDTRICQSDNSTKMFTKRC